MAELKLTDKMTFGKYKNDLVEDVILSDVKYIEWALDDIDWFELDDKAMSIYERSIDDYYDNEY